MNAVLLEDVSDADGADLDTEFFQLACDAVIAPGGVFPGQAEDQLGDALTDALPADPARFLTGGSIL